MRNTVFGRIVAVCVLLLTGVGSMAATVREVRVEQQGMGQSDPEFVLAHVRLAEGDAFSGAAAAQDVKRLMATGQFSAVDVHAEEVGDGEVRLVYAVQPRLRLAADPVIEGVSAFRLSRVRRWLELERGDRIDDQTAGMAVRKVMQEYRRKRYPQATGTWRFEVVNADHGLVTVTFHFEEGERADIRHVEPVGNTALSDRDLRSTLQRPFPWNPWRWIRPKRYERYALAGIEADVRRAYMNRGYLDVAVEISVEPDEDGGVALVEIQEGELYRFGRLEIEGNTLFPETELDALLPMAADQPASLELIEATAMRLQDYYGDRGYLHTGVNPVLTPDRQTLTLDVDFKIIEGELVRIRNVLIRGNTRTRDKVIRRELLVYPGEIYNQSRVQRSERILGNLGYFEQVRVVPEPTTQPDRRDLVFNVTEKRTGQFMVGAGFSSVDNLIGFMELSQGNFDLFGWPYFTGGGQKLRLRLQFGSERTDYDLSFTEPWFLDRRLSLGFDLYRRERDYSDYDLKRTGAAIRLGRALPFASRLNLQYELEKSVITDITDLNTYFFLDTYDFAAGTGEEYRFDSEEDRVKSALTVNWIHDTRNNPFVPTRGNRLSLFYTVAGGPMGFDADFYSTGLQTTSYFPLWFGHVFNIRSRFEFIEPFGDTEEVPLSERLFLGGGRTLRGFRYRDVGPKVIRPIEDSEHFVDRSHGGQSLFMATAEYTIPLVTGIRLGIFYDTGNAWRDSYEVDLGDLVGSAGLGVRLDVPGFPIRIDRAWVLEKADDFTEEETWVIWIGFD